MNAINAINWFELPVVNMDRAVRFYEALLDQKLQLDDFQGVPHAIFSATPKAVGGALIHAPNRKPASEGTTVYFASADIEAALQRVRSLGAEVLLPKTSIGPHGFIALLRDTEGNVAGLHTPLA